MRAGRAPAAMHRGWRRFALAAMCAVAVAAGFLAIMILRPLPDQWITGIDDIGEAVAATSAAVACAWAARRTAERLRVAWTLLALSAGAWAAGQIIWSVYEVALRVTVPSPSVADVGFLLAVPLALAGILAFTTRERGTGRGWSLWLDAAIVALGFVFIAWAAGLNQVARSLDSFGAFVSLAYPVGDILICTALIVVIRRATGQQQGRMLLLLGGLAANAVSDSAFAYLSATGSYNAVGSPLDAGWMIGYLMVALAALWPSSRTDVASERAPIDMWQIALPWLVVVAATGVGMARVAAGIPLDLFLSFVTAAIGALIAVSQVLIHRDSLRMLVEARTSRATLAEVIARAPAGVVRMSPDLRIVDANLRFGELLLTGGQSQAGLSITRFFPTDEAARIVQKLDSLKPGTQKAVESDSEATRVDGTRVWLHWSATSVPNGHGTGDYFIAMFEDTTARHEAEAAASASLEVLDRLNRLKTEFLHSVSHEFKTALIGIQGFSEFMRDSDQLDVGDARAFASDIYRDAARLDRMVNEMMDLDRVESDKANLRITDVDVNTLILSEVEQARTKAAGIAVDVRLDPALPKAAADADKLSIVVRTLLDNALKYSPEHGRVTVTTRAVAASIEVSVADQGSAVRADFDNRLFGGDDLYANNPIRKVVGTGLGLGIARQVVEMHGGHFWVDRIDGVGGSVIHFTVPVAAGVRVA